MATNVSRRVQIIFEGDDRVSSVINGVSGNLDAFSSRISGVTQPLANLTQSILTLEAAAAALAVGGLAAAYVASSNFEAATIELEKVIGDEADQLLVAQENARSLSSTYGQSASEILLATADFRQAGFTVQESMTLTRDAMDLVIAGNIEANLASDLLIATIRGFRAPVDEARVAIDGLNAVSNTYSTNIQELATGLAQLSPIARLMGFSMQETIGILTPIIEIFRSGSEAATALSFGLQRMVTPQALEGLQSLGVAQTDVNGNLRSGRDILMDVATAFTGVSEEQQLFIAGQLVGVRQAARMVEVFTQLGRTTEITAVAMNSAGSAAEEVAIRLQSAQVQVDRFIQGFVNLGIAVGDEFRIAATGAIAGATEIENALQELVRSGAFDELFDWLRQMSNDLGDFFSDVAAALPGAIEQIDFSELTSAFDNVGEELRDIFEAIFGEIDLTTPEGLATFIQEAIDGFIALQNVVAGILDGLEPFIRNVVEIVNDFIEGGDEAQILAGRILGIATSINTLLNAVPLLTGSLDLLSASIGFLTLTRIPAMISGLGQVLGLVGGGAGGLVYALGQMGLVGVVGAASAAFGYFVGSLIADLPVIRDIGTALANVALSAQGLGEAEISLVEARARSTQAAGEQAVEIVRLAEALGELPSQQATEVLVEGSEEYQAELDLIAQQIAQVPETRSTVLTAEADRQSAQDAVNTLYITVFGESGEVFEVPVRVRADQQSIDQARQAVEEIPNEKLLIARIENQTEVEVARIQASAETLQNAFEWNARIDIAEVEQHMATIRTLSDNLTTAFTNTGDVISAMVGSLADLTGYEAFRMLEYIQEESNRRDQLLVAQLALTEAEVRWLDAKTASLERGEAAINVQMDGVYPELEMIMWRVLERIQIQVNNEGLDLLL
jgi:TP901 family phage tail tape measure protein